MNNYFLVLGTSQGLQITCNNFCLEEEVESIQSKP